MAQYIVRRPHKGDKFYQPGDKRECSKNTAKMLIDKGLLFPNYVTKEDKQAYSASNKAYIDHAGGGWYDIKREGEVIGDKKYRKKEAIAKRDEINES